MWYLSGILHDIGNTVDSYSDEDADANLTIIVYRTKIWVLSHLSQTKDIFIASSNNLLIVYSDFAAIYVYVSRWRRSVEIDFFVEKTVK